ncbi:MAG: aldo/keto reductase [Opitutales bacterium]
MDRRRFVSHLAFAALGGLAGRSLRGVETAPQTLITKAIPATGEGIPVIGMGTWITFNVGSAPDLLRQRTAILRTFFARGGGMIDSSPMYGSAERVVGHCLEQLGHPEGLFSATKVWTRSDEEGRTQHQDSLRLWGVSRLDLQQVHNLVNWRDHLKTLRALKERGDVRYIGITTSHGRRHRELEQVMKTEPLDFVQLTYNIARRSVENSLLPLARDRGIAVIANRPYGGGRFIAEAQRSGREVPAWAVEAGCTNWPEFLLKWIVAHPAVTCAIPATSQVAHMRENMGACHGQLPDGATRRRMTDLFATL